MAKLTFREAASSGKIETLITLMAKNLVEPPESMDDLLRSLCVASGLTGLIPIDNSKTGVEKVTEWIDGRLNSAKHCAWLYKSDLINQAKRRAYFKNILLSWSGSTPESIFNEAIEKSNLTTEMSEDGNKIRIAVKRNDNSAPNFTADCPDMDF